MREIKKVQLMVISFVVGLIATFMIASPTYAAVNVNKPTGLKASSIGYKSAKLSWKKAKGVSGYVVFQFNPKTGKYDKVAAKTKSNAVYVKNLNTGGFYGYAVKAYKTVKGKNNYSGYSNIAKFVTKQTKVTGLKAYDSGINYVKLSWKKSAGSTRYTIYQYNKTTAKYGKVADVATPYVKISGLKAGQSYKFCVKGYRRAEKYIGHGDVSGATTAYTPPLVAGGIQQTNFDKTSIELKWNKAEGADGYIIYRYDESTSKWVEKKSVGASTLTYKATGLPRGSEYQYAVRSYAAFGNKQVLAKSYQKCYAVTQIAAATGIEVTGVTSSTATIKWDKLKGADEYHFYRYDAESDISTYMTKTTKTSYKLTGLDSYSTYNYIIYGVMNSKETSTRIYRGEPAKVTVNTELGTPANLSVKEKTTKSISYKWDKVKNATGYNVSVYDKNDKLLQSTKLDAKTTEYTYSQATEGVISITLKVESFARKITVSSQTPQYVYGGTASLTASNIMDKVTGLARNAYGEDYLGITWNAMQYANKYEIYQLKGEEFVKVAETTKNTYRFEELTPGTTYVYKVGAVMANVSYELKGDLSDELELITKHSAPEVSIAGACSSFIKLSWNKMSNITGYKVYKYQASTGDYDLVKTIANPNTLTYTDTAVSSGKTYKYKVRGYKNIGEIGYYGIQCEPVEAKIGVYGVDISKYQGIVDWKKVKEAGIDFAIIRATTKAYSSVSDNGTKLVKDTHFDTNMKNAIAAGIRVGVYVYSYADSVEEARNEAKLAMNIVKNYKLQYPIYYDIEDPARKKASYRTENTNMAIAFCDTVKAGGYKAGVYSGASFFTTYLYVNKLTAYDIWVARYLYSSDTKFYYPSGIEKINKVINMGYHYNNKYTSINAEMWQFTSTGRVPGISGNVDMNYAYISY